MDGDIRKELPFGGERVNYIAEIKAFYDWLDTNPNISASAISLWHALMSIANKSGWQTEFTVAISTLESKTRYGRDTIYSARNQLQQAERIKVKSRGGKLAAAYEMIPLCVGISDATAHTNPTLQPTRSTTIK